MDSRLPARILAFPDANVLLHGKALHLIPWSTVLQCQEVVLILSSSVLSELDTLMHVGSPGMRSRAKKRARALFQMRTDVDPVGLSPGTTLEFARVARPATYKRHELNRDWGDDRLLAVVLERRDAAPDDCVIVTIDYNLTNIAETHGLRWHVLEEKYRLPVPADPEVTRLRREVDSLKQAQRLARVRVICDEPRGVIGLPRPEFTPLSDEQFDAAMAQMTAKHPKRGPRPPGTPIFYPERDRQTYNQELDEAYKSYAVYLRQLEAQQFLIACTSSVRLTVLNGGSAPAGDVQIHLEIDAPGMTFVEPSKLKEMPKPPKFPSSQLNSLAAISLTHSRLGPAAAKPKPSRLLNVLDQTHAVYVLDTLMHGLPETVVIPILLDPASAASGTIRFSTHANGQPEATRGEVAIVVED